VQATQEPPTHVSPFAQHPDPQQPPLLLPKVGQQTGPLEQQTLPAGRLQQPFAQQLPVPEGQQAVPQTLLQQTLGVVHDVAVPQQVFTVVPEGAGQPE